MTDSSRAPRTRRSNETREQEQRLESYTPPSALPTPDPRDGISFRWIRASTMGEPDHKNVSARFREGYVPVKAVDFPEVNLQTDHGSRFPEGIEVGGLLLCQISTAKIAARHAYYNKVNQAQADSVDKDFLNGSDPRMPVSSNDVNRRTTVS